MTWVWACDGGRREGWGVLSRVSWAMPVPPRRVCGGPGRVALGAAVSPPRKLVFVRAAWPVPDLRSQLGAWFLELETCPRSFRRVIGPAASTIHYICARRHPRPRLSELLHRGAAGLYAHHMAFQGTRVCRPSVSFSCPPSRAARMTSSHPRLSRSGHPRRRLELRRRVGLRSLSLPSTTWKVQYVVLQYYRWYNGTY